MKWSAGNAARDELMRQRVAARKLAQPPAADSMLARVLAEVKHSNEFPSVDESVHQEKIQKTEKVPHQPFVADVEEKSALRWHLRDGGHLDPLIEKRL